MNSGRLNGVAALKAGEALIDSFLIVFTLVNEGRNRLGASVLEGLTRGGERRGRRILALHFLYEGPKASYFAALGNKFHLGANKLLLKLIDYRLIAGKFGFVGLFGKQEVVLVSDLLPANSVADRDGKADGGTLIDAGIVAGLEHGMLRRTRYLC